MIEPHGEKLLAVDGDIAVLTVVGERMMPLELTFTVQTADGTPAAGEKEEETHGA